MRLIDLYFRAFHNFRKITSNHPLSQRERKHIAHANEADDVLTSLQYICHVEEDWVSNIEEGLVFIEKAIREDRQFIRTEGNIVQIEKVKKTSKESVEHLARHSNLITKKPKEKTDTLIPEQLYVVEKLTDFAVYENRFLYMLLSYLKDFIQMRLDQIKDKTTTYEANLTIHKDVKTNDRHLKYALTYHLTHKNDPYLIDLYQQSHMIRRIENIYSLVISFLGTPLMKEVSKSPMIKPPIVKTNVLRMNQNFRGAVALYEFVIAYKKLGFTFEEKKKTYNPLPTDLSDELADVIELTSSVTYIYGQDLKKQLNKRLEEEQKEEQKKLIEKEALELKKIKKLMLEQNETPENYILRLEKYIKQLEKQQELYLEEKDINQQLKIQIEDLTKDLTSFDDKIQTLTKTITEKDLELETLKQTYLDTYYEIMTNHEHEIKDLSYQYETKIDEIKETYENSINELKINHQDEIYQLKESFINEKNNIINEFNEKIRQYQEELQFLTLEFSRKEKVYQDKIQALESELDSTITEKLAMSAKYHALVQQTNPNIKEDFTSKERFKELEREMEAYKKFFKMQWKETKVKIRKRVKEEMESKSEDQSES
ncbi:hypothetical protein [Acholeplasma equifetale]|uniref:hypothetical protein n=1 Tax=Acholeplasma equifetale TaxID=264634 RepID=UPI00047EF99B|nr:hypothetical protein [Acholeplasma equifetale]